MTKPMSAVQADFDHIASLSDGGWDQNSHYHDYLLKHVPRRCAYALDVGCGTGAFSRRLAERADRVLALDLSPEMIRVARERSARYLNIDYQVADVLTWNWPAGQFDCVASIATLHHLPFEHMLNRMKRALKPGGVLLILDLFQADGPSDALTSLLAVPANTALKLIKTGRLREPREVREAWDAHGRGESYLTLAQIRWACATVLPGAQVRKHLLWRYSVVWENASPQFPAGIRT